MKGFLKGNWSRIARKGKWPCEAVVTEVLRSRHAGRAIAFKRSQLYSLSSAILSLVARHLVSVAKTRSEVNYLLELEEVTAGRSGGGKGGRERASRLSSPFGKFY